MSGYTLREVQQLLRISSSLISSFVRAGFVVPARGKRKELRFSFQDLILMRTAQGLSSASVPAQRISRSLKRLRDQLPHQLPLSGLRISALGNRVIVREGVRQWQPDTGQYLFDFDVAPRAGGVAFLARAADAAQPSADEFFERGCALENDAPEQAFAAYQYAIERDPSHMGAHANLGRLLHETGRLTEAESVYRCGLKHAGDALLFFNLGVLLEDLARTHEAICAYEAALQIEPTLADAHYNLGLLYEQAGRARDALRHLGAYRQLQQ